MQVDSTWAKIWSHVQKCLLTMALYYFFRIHTNTSMISLRLHYFTFFFCCYFLLLFLFCFAFAPFKNILFSQPSKYTAHQTTSFNVLVWKHGHHIYYVPHTTCKGHEEPLNVKPMYKKEQYNYICLMLKIRIRPSIFLSFHLVVSRHGVDLWN